MDQATLDIRKAADAAAEHLMVCVRGDYDEPIEVTPDDGYAESAVTRMLRLASQAAPGSELHTAGFQLASLLNDAIDDDS